MFKNLSLAIRTIVPGILFAIIVAVIMYLQVNKKQRDLAIQQASKTTKAISRQVAADRQVYTSEVVSKLLRDGLPIIPSSRATYPNEVGGVPLPAAFVHNTSEVVNSGLEKTHRVDLLSLWNINQVKGPRTPWEEQALRYVSSNPREQKGELVGEGDDIRYTAVTADVATAQACVTCHNTLPQSPKKNFQLNDVMGGLVVSVPMVEEFKVAKANALNLTLLLLGAFVALLFFQWLLVNRPLIRDLGKLEKAAEQISMGELDTPLSVDGKDEIGRLGSTFERMRTSLKASLEELDK